MAYFLIWWSSFSFFLANVSDMKGNPLGARVQKQWRFNYIEMLHIVAFNTINLKPNAWLEQFGVPSIMDHVGEMGLAFQVSMA